MHSGYKTAVELALGKLAACDPLSVCARCGVRFEDGQYHLPWFNESRPLMSGSDTEKVIWLHYLISEGTRHPTGKWIAFRDIPGARGYESNFMGRSVRPFVKKFGNTPHSLLEAGIRLGGEETPAGHCAVTLWPFPYVPLTYVLWVGDDEFPADGNILFDETAHGWLPAEDLVVLASLGAYALIK